MCRKRRDNQYLFASFRQESLSQELSACLTIQNLRERGRLNHFMHPGEGWVHERCRRLSPIHNGIVKLGLESEGERTNSQGVGRFVVTVNCGVAGTDTGTREQVHC